MKIYRTETKSLQLFIKEHYLSKETEKKQGTWEE